MGIIADFDSTETASSADPIKYKGILAKAEPSGNSYVNMTIFDSIPRSGTTIVGGVLVQALNAEMKSIWKTNPSLGDEVEVEFVPEFGVYSQQYARRIPNNRLVKAKVTKAGKAEVEENKPQVIATVERATLHAGVPAQTPAPVADVSAYDEDIPF